MEARIQEFAGIAPHDREAWPGPVDTQSAFLMTDELPDQPETAQARRQTTRRRRLRKAVAALLVIFAVFCAATARLIVWPAQGMPARVDAIVVLGGYGNRLGTGIDLWHQGRAPVLVVSLGVGIPVPASVCASHSQTIRGICFDPVPRTTQGEAEAVGRLAKQYRWRSIVLVTSPDQDTRARIRFERCFPGSVYVVTTALPLSKWPYQIVYQWAALFKALVLQPNC
jgi:uncharacterized SAM-binding protein YcdF (DUF218 family)